jgi:hypothetical protein
MDTSEQNILQKNLARFIIDDVFNLPEEKDILAIHTPQKWVYQDRELIEAEVVQLRGQAERLLESELWKILKNGLRHDAITRGVTKSQTEGDQIASKVELYLIQTVENLLKHMSQKP